MGKDELEVITVLKDIVDKQKSPTTLFYDFKLSTRQIEVLFTLFEKYKLMSDNEIRDSISRDFSNNRINRFGGRY